tara:strand:- start:66571 stop:67659 length:1089 start_codon:yes stop_codon:yes gene_type:complete
MIAVLVARDEGVDITYLKNIVRSPVRIEINPMTSFALNPYRTDLGRSILDVPIDTLQAALIPYLDYLEKMRLSLTCKRFYTLGALAFKEKFKSLVLDIQDRAYTEKSKPDSEEWIAVVIRGEGVTIAAVNWIINKENLYNSDRNSRRCLGLWEVKTLIHRIYKHGSYDAYLLHERANAIIDTKLNRMRKEAAQYFMRELDHRGLELVLNCDLNGDSSSLVELKDDINHPSLKIARIDYKYGKMPEFHNMPFHGWRDPKFHKAVTNYIINGTPMEFNFLSSLKIGDKTSFYPATLRKKQFKLPPPVKVKLPINNLGKRDRELVEEMATEDRKKRKHVDFDDEIIRLDYFNFECFMVADDVDMV